SVAERLGQGLVHEAVLLEQRETAEARARDRHLEVVAAAGAVLGAELVRSREGAAKQRLEALGGHRPRVGAGPYPVARWSSDCSRSASCCFPPSACRCTSSSLATAS